MTNLAYPGCTRSNRVRLSLALVAILIGAAAADPASGQGSTMATPDIQPGGQYTVARGDTIGTIAAGMEGREPGTIQAIADQILELNPHAFEDGDPTEMRLGAVLSLPGDGPWMRRDAGRNWHTNKSQAIDPGTNYRVAAGDTLSMIAGRVRGRLPGSIKTLAAAILADNPQAFAGGNASRIQLGAIIAIPTTGSWAIRNAVAESPQPVAPSKMSKTASTADLATSAKPASEPPSSNASDRSLVALKTSQPETKTRAESDARTSPQTRPQPELPEATQATVASAQATVPVSPAKRSEPAPEKIGVTQIENADGMPVPVSGSAPRPVPGKQVENTPVRLADEKPAVGGSDNLYRLDSGDRIRVTIYGHDDLSGEFDIDGAGRLSLPLVESVAARGVSIDQPEAAIIDMLRPDYLRNPRVALKYSTIVPFTSWARSMRPAAMRTSKV
jgi:Tfp pilus assembly protein FimV